MEGEPIEWPETTRYGYKLEGWYVYPEDVYKRQVYGDAALVCRKRRARGHYRINLQGDFQTAGAFVGSPRCVCICQNGS